MSPTSSLSIKKEETSTFEVSVGAPYGLANPIAPFTFPANSRSKFNIVDKSDKSKLQLDYNAIADERDETINIYTGTNTDTDKLFPNNTIYVSVGKKYVMMLNKYHEDELKTEFIPKNKLQLLKHFKFTAWLITRDYFKECIRIFEEHKLNTESPESPKLSIFHKIPDNIKNNVLYHITSIQGVDNVKEILEHVEKHKKFIKDFIISQDPTLCKAYNPTILVNPISDVSSSILHFHFIQDIIHFNTLKLINFKYELLNSSSSIYERYISNTYELNKILNILKINHDALFNNKLHKNYLPSLKCSALFSKLEY